MLRYALYGTNYCLYVKPEYQGKARAIFHDVNITTTGHRYLGSYIGTEHGVKVSLRNRSKTLEHLIQEEFVPAIIGKSFIDDDVREILSLPARYGGMSLGNVAEYSDRVYLNSVQMTAQLALSIVNKTGKFIEH